MILTYNRMQGQGLLQPITRPVMPPSLFHVEADPSHQLTLEKQEFSTFEYLQTSIEGLTFADIPRVNDFSRAEGPTLLVYYEYLNVFLNSALQTNKNPKQIKKRLTKLQERYKLSQALSSLDQGYWSVRHLLCGEVNSTTTVRCMDCDNTRTHKTSRCDLRGCPVCAAKRSNELKHAYRADLQRHYNPHTIRYKHCYNLRFMTLTFPNISSIDDLDYTYYLKVLNRFLRRKGTKATPGAKRFIKKYLYRFECPYKSKEKGYNPHFHLLIYSKIIPVEHLSSLWKVATKGTAEIVDIRNISSVKSASNEVIKYCAKADDFCDSLEQAKFMIKMKHRRFLGVSGFKADPKSPLVCECCGCTEWAFVSGRIGADDLFHEIMQFQQTKSTLKSWEI